MAKPNWIENIDAGLMGLYAGCKILRHAGIDPHLMIDPIMNELHREDLERADKEPDDKCKRCGGKGWVDECCGGDSLKTTSCARCNGSGVESRSSNPKV